MNTLSLSQFDRARRYIERHARPVDAALFHHDFSQGPATAVWDALSGYANADGGFGMGIEPDCRLPGSSVLGTITAFTYLEETNAPGDHPLVRNGIDFLIQNYDARTGGWPMLPPEADQHPRAAWWNYTPPADSSEAWANPSAAVVAAFCRYREGVPGQLFEEALKKAVMVFEAVHHSLIGHDFLVFAQLAKVIDPHERNRFWEALKARAPAAIQTDPAQWDGYGIRPLWAVPDPGSPLFPELAESVQAHLDFEIRQQQPDGSWHPFWSWGRFETDWKSARGEWQGQLTVRTLRSLKAFGRIAR